MHPRLWDDLQVRNDHPADLVNPLDGEEVLNVTSPGPTAVGDYARFLRQDAKAYSGHAGPAAHQ